MFCKKCGNPINEFDMFCKNCGTAIDKTVNIQNQNLNNLSNNYQQPTNTIHRNNNNSSQKQKIIVFVCAFIIVIILIIVIALSFGKNNSNNNENITNNDSSNTYENNNKIKGQYSRETFSGNSFEYITDNDEAVFTFNEDSTFEVNYIGGNTYKGTYAVYNGIYIAIKTSDIKNDITIDNREMLASDIDNVTNAMIDSTGDLLNTYLLWLEVDNGILQPFAISYNPDTNSGTAVNIFARTQGAFNLK